MTEKEQQSAVKLLDLEQRARRRLPQAIFDHIAGAACDEITLRENIAAFRRIKLLPRVLRDSNGRSPAVSVLGETIAFPVLLGPVACLRRFHPEGELAVARAARTAGTIAVISTGACFSLEEVAAAAGGPLWFQLYAYRDREITKDLISRAEAAGYKAICLTVDVPVDGKKERDLRNRYVYPKDLLAKSMVNAGFASSDLRTDDLASFSARALAVSLTWNDLDWLKSATGLPFLLKGILSSDDAARAVSCGVEGIVVSNHGGRQLDGVPAAINVLPFIAETVQGRAEIFLDGGIRRGTDVVKAIALGAKAVLIARPYVWGLAAEGECGVSRAIEILRTEFENAMILTGCSRTEEMDRALIWQASGEAPRKHSQSDPQQIST